jgi:glyoxylase-like metal-dependent hydrolase (beta-lactamase superfamily II)
MRFLFRLSFLLCFSCAVVLAQSPDAALPFQLKLIGPNIWAAIDDAKGDAGANAGFVVGDDGVTVIDTFENEVAAKALMGQIHALTHLPIKFVINTHYHLDHVAGNRVFAQHGAVIVGHHSVRAWIHSENLKFFGEKIKPEEKAMVENLLAPEVTYDTGVTLFLGTRRIEVTYMQGHTGGDSVVSIPDAGIVFCGDLFWRHTLPNLIDATTATWISTLSAFTEQKSDTLPNSALPRAVIFVPGHGDVGNGDDVQEFQAYLIWLRGAVKKGVDENKKGDALVGAVMPELTEKYGNWDFFKDFSRSNIVDAGAELEGIKRIPVAQRK